MLLVRSTLSRQINGRVHDTRKTRIEKQTEIDLRAADLSHEYPVVCRILESYERAVADPGDELVHLYEVWEAITGELGGEGVALKTLGLSKSNKNNLTMLANNAPVQEGRHRGAHHTKQLRAAMEEELGKARGFVRTLIDRYHPIWTRKNSMPKLYGTQVTVLSQRAEGGSGHPM